MVYIYDLPEGSTINVKLFAGDASLLSFVHDSIASSISLNKDLLNNFLMGLPKENDIQPKCLKTGPRGCFSLKAIATKHATVYFNNVSLKRENFQKHFGLLLFSKLNFFGYINEKNKKANKCINVIRKMNFSLPRSFLLSIYNSFVRSHLDYGEVIDDQPNNSNL